MNNVGEVSSAFRRTRLPHVSRVIVERLARDFEEWVPTEAIIAAVYGEREDGGPEHARGSLNVIIHLNRPLIRACGFDIEVQIGGRMGGSWRRLVRFSDDRSRSPRRTATGASPPAVLPKPLRPKAVC